LLVFILEAFEELGLDVLQARVSCADSFTLEALGNKVSMFFFLPARTHILIGGNWVTSTQTIIHKKML